MLLQIDINRREIAARILRWVVTAVRPLTLSELSAAIEPAVKIDADFTRDDKINDQVSYCGYLLTIQRGQVNIIHQSAKEYSSRKERDADHQLEYFRVEEKIANAEVARRCFYDMQDGALPDEEPPKIRWTSPSDSVDSYLEASPLQSYAIQHWPLHVTYLTMSDEIFDLSLPFYRKDSMAHRWWMAAHQFQFREAFAVPSELLHMASFSGVLPIVESLLPQKGLRNKMRNYRSVNRKDDHGMTALLYAVRGGHFAMVKLLLDKRADIEAKDTWNQNALIHASAEGHRDIVTILLGKAHIDVKDAWKRTALIHATRKGYHDIVMLLLEKGANIETKDEDGLNALLHASTEGHRDIVTSLLARRANVDVMDTNKHTPLSHASSRGHRDIVKCLLDKGVDVEAKAYLQKTALAIASEQGEMSIVELLFQKGATLEARDLWGYTALLNASLSGQTDTVRFLLDLGAYVGAKSYRNETALLLSIILNHEDITQMLLTRGADVNVAEDQTGDSPLIKASIAMNQRGMELLVEKGGKVNAENIKRETALSI